MLFSRRSAMLSALAAFAAPPRDAWAQPAPSAAPDEEPPVTILRVQRRSIEVNKKPASVLGIRQPDGTPGLTTEAGKAFRVRVENELSEPTLIHWHGLTPPWQQDGVPGVSGPPIPPGGTGEYNFPLRFGGTFWMHSHQGLQEQELLAAPLIIHGRHGQREEQEAVIMLADFSFTPAEAIYEALRKRKRMAAMAGPPGAAGTGEMEPPSPMAMPAKPQRSGMAEASAQAKPDLNDVTYDAFLANDRTLADPEVIQVEPGGHVRLRVINSSAMSAYHLDLGALRGELVAVDGFAIHPVSGGRFPLAVAQRLDIRIAIPSGPAAYPVLAILEGGRRQTGVILQAGRAEVKRIPEIASEPSAALSLDLESMLRAEEPLAPRKADRVHKIELTGDMQSYIWSLNGVAWNKDVPPLPIAEGERVELVLTNKTLMPHPMHLHGHEF
ncbi:MAG TPA: multicopper oxidase domain-containing protein, partial [Methylocella sp.]|nr:multicopper oxidase domain-containing protein [Methylocella sp.]